MAYPVAIEWKYQPVVKKIKKGERYVRNMDTHHAHGHDWAMMHPYGPRPMGPIGYGPGHPRYTMSYADPFAHNQVAPGFFTTNAGIFN